MKNSLIDIIDNWGIEDPRRVCFESKGSTYTYGQLKSDSDKVASYLASSFKNKKPVVIFGGLEYEMIMTFIGCVKAGHAYIPIDSHTPIERVELILSVADYAAVIPWSNWEIQNTENVIDTKLLLSGSDNVEVCQQVTGEENFYIIFTSGTTGVPKGVQISHDNLIDYIDWMLTDFGITEGGTFLSQAPYSFDLSVMDVYPALVSGGKLVPMGKELINDFKELFIELPKMRLNVWVSTPSFADICLMNPAFSGQENPDLTHFLFCGEELTHTTAKKLVERFPNARVYNMYGPTEATVAITEIEITPKILDNCDRLPIGRVKPGTTIYIMDEDNNELSEGEVGEIVISGPTVSKGYYQNTDKTSEAFFTYKGTQSYRTGDAGLMEKGVLFYQGRMDFQVKLNGYRIELEDVDHHLMDVSYVKNAIVVPKYVEHKVQQLVAYVVPHKHEFEKDYHLSKAIKEELKETVMDYMIPKKYVYVDALPLTQNGKIDRKALITEVNS